MSTTRPGTTTDRTWVNGDKASVSRLRTTRSRAGIPHLLLGVLLVLVCAGGFALLALHSGGKKPVLALARDLVVGQVLTEQDLLEVAVAADPGVGVVSADQADALLGKPMATSMSAGTLLNLDAVGVAAIPRSGHGLVALALKAGQFPPEVSAGTEVSVVFVPGQAGATSRPPADSGTTWSAVVTGVTTPSHEQITVVSVQLQEDAARQVAAVPAGQVSLMLLPAAGAR
ncbi:MULTISPECIES: hypothetical protein [Actinosynnema]|uniref:hypothetical protein n=1 Tax=Actinosynnema TaxID=40566 RepID=UPI0020A5FB1D|nr:hypothetical protein [Actinosynnema pretiosum]MCP2098080.1 hypothetical protein [Actinosynnema pretiosum]